MINGTVITPNSGESPCRATVLARQSSGLVIGHKQRRFTTGRLVWGGLLRVLQRITHYKHGDHLEFKLNFSVRDLLTDKGRAVKDQVEALVQAVQKAGSYQAREEAARAVHAVMDGMKGWVPADALSKLTESAPVREAARLGRAASQRLQKGELVRVSDGAVAVDEAVDMREARGRRHVLAFDHPKGTQPRYPRRYARTIHDLHDVSPRPCRPRASPRPGSCGPASARRCRPTRVPVRSPCPGPASDACDRLITLPAPWQVEPKVCGHGLVRALAYEGGRAHVSRDQHGLPD